MPRVPSVAAVGRWHDYAIYRYGGAYGLRDLGLLESALAAPRQVAAYGSRDIAEQAGALTYSLVKRTAFIVLAVFLRRAGYRVRFGMEWVEIIEGVANGRVSRDALVAHIRSVLPPRVFRRNPGTL